MKMQSEEVIERVFPDIRKIKNPRLRSSVCKCWLSAWKYGDYERIEDAPRSRKLPKESLVLHVTAVTKIAAEIAALLEKIYGWKINYDLLLAASLLRDIDKMVSEKARENYEVASWFN
jgi:hypothetical protein